MAGCGRKGKEAPGVTIRGWMACRKKKGEVCRVREGLESKVLDMQEGG